MGAILGTGGRGWVYVGQKPARLGEWVHLTVTYDGNKVVVYLNGQKFTEQENHKILLVMPPTVPIRIGQSVENPDMRFNGIVDEIWIFPKVIAEIENLKKFGETK